MLYTKRTMPTYFGFTMKDIIDANLLDEYLKGGEHKKKVELRLSRPLLKDDLTKIDKRESNEYIINNGLPNEIKNQINKKY